MVYGDRIFAGSFDGYVYALWRSSGELAWKFKSVGHRFFPAGEMQGNLVAGNGLVYVGGRDYNIYALDTAKGFSHWNRQFPKGWVLALSVSDTVLYAGTSNDDLVLALDARTGGIRWRFETDGYTTHRAEYFKTEGRPVKEEFYAIVGTPEGYIEALHKLGAIFSTPVVAGDRTYVTSTDVTVYCLGR